MSVLNVAAVLTDTDVELLVRLLLQAIKKLDISRHDYLERNAIIDLTFFAS